MFEYARAGYLVALFARRWVIINSRRYWFTKYDGHRCAQTQRLSLAIGFEGSEDPRRHDRHLRAARYEPNAGLGLLQATI